MTMDASNYPYGLGGLQNGGYRAAHAQASGYSNYTSSSAYVGTISANTVEVPEYTFEDAGIRAGEIIGYRAWFLSDGLLRSMFANFTWFPGVIEKAHEIDEGWGTGLHAFKTLEEARTQYNYADVWGEVAMWGVVFEYEQGYRAEYAAVRKIIKVSGDFPIWRPRARILQRRYRMLSSPLSKDNPQA